MKLSQFDYFLPEELIALKPPKNRMEDKLMVLHKNTLDIEHKKFKDIINYFTDGDRLVFNNTKIFPSVLKGKKEKTDADIEVFLLRELIAENKIWDVLVNPARKIRIGNKLYFDNNLIAEVIDNTTSRGRTVRFLYSGSSDDLKKSIRKMGRVPLPPFIKREAKPEDFNNYMSPFSKIEGAVAAPTASTHFDKNILKKLEIKGVNFSEITLHAGIGNYVNIEVEDLSKHKPDSERVTINPEVANEINKTLDEEKRICAIGTTVIKALETPVTTHHRLDPFDAWTVQFIFPPHKIRIPKVLVTNFQLPKTPMMMTVAAFAGYRFAKRAYEEAVQKNYKFGPFGDAMLIF